MEQEVNQVVQAILVAWDPAQSALHQQALQFLSSVQNNSSETWRLGLALFVETGPDGRRKHHPQARFFGLRILEEYLENKYTPLDDDSFGMIQQALVSYIQSEYVYGPAEASAPFLRNKFSHTLTLFFLCTYLEQWPTFFTDLFALIRPPPNSDSQQSSFNPHISLLLFHLVLEISGEVADQMLKAARTFNATRHSRDGRVRDAVRERDAAGINEAVLTIVADAADNLSRLRKGEAGVSKDGLVEVMDWGVRTFGSYVGWIDINLTVTPSTIPLLFSLLSDPELPIRLATSGALLRMVTKGLKEAGDKLQLIKVLSLGQVLEALETKTRSEQESRGEDTDDGEESYREALGRLLNALGLELSKVADDENAASEVRTEASSSLEQIMPVMIRFLADPYDDTSSTVFPLLANILLGYKKLKRSAPQEITDSKRAFLSSVLTVLLEKMKWEEDADPADMDDDDKHAFESLRKGDLRIHLDSILTIDQDLVISTVQSLVLSTLSAYESGVTLKWNVVELAIYLIYIFGEINKSGGKGRAAFCQAPSAKDMKVSNTDFAEYPLTAHGEMLLALVRSNICAFPHPTVTMQYFETCARYGDFFKVRKECIIPLLEAMIGTRGVHHPDLSVRSRVFYLFYKFIKEDRNEISVTLVETLLNGIRDKLAIEVEIPEPNSNEQQDLLTEAVNNSGVFDSQLYLFETAGILVSLTSKEGTQTESLLLSIVQPLLDELSFNLRSGVKSADDVLPIVKSHHLVMALGNVAKGFPDFPSPIPANFKQPPVAIFQQMTQAIIVSLEAMNIFKVVRDATRFAFARIVAVSGPNVTQFIPALMSSLLAHFEPSELVDFMNFIGVLMHKLQESMFNVLDELISPLGARIIDLVSQPVTGTDDKLAQTDTKKAYFTFLNNIMINKLQGIFISPRNQPQLESFLTNVQQFAGDTTDPACQKLALTFLSRCVTAWGQPDTAAPATNGKDQTHGISDSLPGFDRFIYETIIPLAFRIPSMPNFNIKDGQMLVDSQTLHEIAALLQNICKTRKDEAFTFLVSAFLPAQNCPPETAVQFATNLRDLDSKAFRKYFTDFVRASRGTS
ncbi:ARM repeat-containing protein [Rickenella mellea]|uniref:Exportin-T n=1 Tax=Rickenella mellea TaxID=50990 RepID=A0A4Y7QEU4_9AGAM|nr:ARM repeat-containing protein [Rickenella mellea]